MRNKIKWSLVLILLAGCAVKQVRVEQDLPVTIVHQSNRAGDLEPCGCQTNPYGGIDREANAVKQIRKERENVLYVDSGNLFTNPKLLGGVKHHRQKAKTIVEILNYMGLDVFSPGPYDYLLGLDFLKRAERLSRFKYLSTNVVDAKQRTLFEPFHLEAVDGVVFGFLSLTPPGSIQEAGVVVEDPRKSLQKWLPQVRQRADIVVLLSQMGTKLDGKLGKEFDINILVGCDRTIGSDLAYWMAKGRGLLVDSQVLGSFVGRLDIDFRFPFKGFYSEKEMQEKRKRVAAVEAKLKEKGENQSAKKYLQELKKTALLNPIEGGSLYQHKLIPLDKKRFGKNNKISQMMKAEKARQRKRALSE